MDWVTVSSLATAGGTLVLAVATFGATRSSNRSARVAELALRQQMRPVLVHSQLDDPAQKIMFFGGKWVRVQGSGAAVEHDDGVVYLSMSLRNVGSGIGVLLGWHVWPEITPGARQPPVAAEEFRTQTRDLYIPAGGIGLWQGALRDDSEELHGRMIAITRERTSFLIDLLYADHTGGQRSISRFSVVPMQEENWLCSVTRHWDLDGQGAG
jgi:hypothetical protein